MNFESCVEGSTGYIFSGPREEKFKNFVCVTGK